MFSGLFGTFKKRIVNLDFLGLPDLSTISLYTKANYAIFYIKNEWYVLDYVNKTIVHRFRDFKDGYPKAIFLCNFMVDYKNLNQEDLKIYIFQIETGENYNTAKEFVKTFFCLPTNFIVSLYRASNNSVK